MGAFFGGCAAARGRPTALSFNREQAMQFERIEVETRDGYQGAQEPVSFQWRGQHFAVAEILDRWYEGFRDARRVPLRYFKVRCPGGEEFILRYHELFCAWSLVIPRPAAEN